MLNDLKSAIRQLIKSPGFTVVAVLSLALGIGANTAIFSLVDEVLLKALPVKAPKELVTFHWSQTHGQAPMHDLFGGFGSFSVLTYERLQENHEALTDVFASGLLWESNVSVDGRAEIAEVGQLVSGNYFSGLGVQPFLGRMIAPADDRAAAPGVAVISYRYWQSRLGGDPKAVGKVIRINNVEATIIGVAPPGFLGVAGADSPRDLSIPLAMWPKVGAVWTYRPDQRASSWWLSIMGRLKPGVTPAEAQASLKPIFDQSVREIYATMNRPPRQLFIPDLSVRPATRSSYEDSESQRSLLILMGLVGLVLLVACANVANLLLARGIARRKEIAVRLGLGARRARIVRQLMVESVLLGLLGGALGLLLAVWCKGLLLSLHPLGSGVVLTLPLDAGVLAFTTAISVGTSLIFGMAPALRATRLDLTAEFQGGTRSVIGSRSAFRLGKSLMVAQVALSVVLLIGAGLFVRTLHNLESVDAGFERHHLLLFRIDSSRIGYNRDRFFALCDRLSARIGSLPGVKAAAFSGTPVLSGSEHGPDFTIPGYVSPGGEPPTGAGNTVSTNFFATFGMPILIGRGFDARDDARSAKVVVINQTFANRYFPGENPIGRRIEPFGAIVGVARDAKYIELKETVPPTLFSCFSQGPDSQANFAVRTVGDPKMLIGQIQRTVQAIEPTLPLADIRTQDEQVDDLYSQQELLARLSGFFGMLAMALVSAGLYGLMSYSVLRRTNEIGIRVALGAVPARIVAMVFGETLFLVCLGLLIGSCAAGAATRLVSSMLYGLSAIDPVTYSAIALLLVVVALIASWLPARRAARVDPVSALRAE